MEKRVNFNISLQCIIYNEKKQILLLKRCNTNYCDGMYALPGGHLEENENVLRGMIRELKEELDLDFLENELSLFKVINRKIGCKNYLDFIFEANLKNRNPINLEFAKCSELLFCSPLNLPENIIPFINDIFKLNDFYLNLEEVND